MIQTRELGENQISTAAALIRSGKLVVFPTETVYGLGANARDPLAVAGIFQAKGRPQDNPLIVHIASLAALDEVAVRVGPLARLLMEHFCPGPLTVILQRHPDLAPAVSAGLDTVGVRIPASAIACDFLAACAVPVAAPSANRSGLPSPTSFDMAWAAMQGRVEAVLRGPDALVGLESTIVWPESETTLHILRPGSISPAMLRDFLDLAGYADVSIRMPGRSSSGGIDLPRSPGTRHRHYSPQAKVHLFSGPAELAALVGGQSLQAGSCSWMGLVGFMGESGELSAFLDGLRLRRQFASISEYAQGLYSCMAQADAHGCQHVLAWLPEETDETIALRDRLFRASGYVD